MSAFDQNRAVPLGAVTLFRLTSLIEQTSDALKSWYHARGTAKSLNGLSDRSLRDIGVERAEIQDIARHLARG